MILFFGVGKGSDDLYLDQKIVCPMCGKKAELQVYCDYKAFQLFFIPVYKWDKRYYARTTCCGAVCPVPFREGEALDSGDIERLDVKRLPLVQLHAAPQLKVCAACGYETSQPFRFCPMCGKPLGDGQKHLR
jgi:ribosomal protein L32